MFDTLPVWFWLPAAVVAWGMVLIPIVRSHADDVDPNDLTRLDVLDRRWTA